MISQGFTISSIEVVGNEFQTSKASFNSVYMKYELANSKAELQKVCARASLRSFFRVRRWSNARWRHAVRYPDLPLYGIRRTALLGFCLRPFVLKTRSPRPGSELLLAKLCPMMRPYGLSIKHVRLPTTLQSLRIISLDLRIIIVSL
jgi:hypothetical protein